MHNIHSSVDIELLAEKIQKTLPNDFSFDLVAEIVRETVNKITTETKNDKSQDTIQSDIANTDDSNKNKCSKEIDISAHSISRTIYYFNLETINVSDIYNHVGASSKKDFYKLCNKIGIDPINYQQIIIKRMLAGERPTNIYKDLEENTLNKRKLWFDIIVQLLLAALSAMHPNEPNQEININNTYNITNNLTTDSYDSTDQIVDEMSNNMYKD